MAGEGDGRGMGTACYVWIGLNTRFHVIDYPTQISTHPAPYNICNWEKHLNQLITLASRPQRITKTDVTRQIAGWVVRAEFLVWSLGAFCCWVPVNLVSIGHCQSNVAWRLLCFVICLGYWYWSSWYINQKNLQEVPRNNIQNVFHVSPN